MILQKVARSKGKKKIDPKFILIFVWVKNLMQWQKASGYSG